MVPWPTGFGRDKTHFRFTLSATFLIAMSPVMRAAWRTFCAGCGALEVFSRA